MMRFITAVLTLVAFLVSYGASAGLISAGTVSAGNEQPSQATSGGGGAAKPWTNQGTTTDGGVDAMPDETDPNFDPATDYYAIIAYNSTDSAGFHDDNKLVAEAQGFGAGDVEWRGAYSGSMKCYVKTYNAPQNPDHGPYKAWAEANVWAQIGPYGGAASAASKHDVVEIRNEASGELTKPVSVELTQPDPNDPNVTLPYRSSSGAGSDNKIEFKYGIGGSVDLVANRPEVEVGAWVETVSVSASLTGWDPATGSVINKADGTPGVWTMN